MACIPCWPSVRLTERAAAATPTDPNRNHQASPAGSQAVLTLLECGPACGCGCSTDATACPARAAQQGVRARLAVRRYPGKVRGQQLHASLVSFLQLGWRLEAFISS
jgi:hypothetical protein